jgi:hypothetical protein
MEGQIHRRELKKGEIFEEENKMKDLSRALNVLGVLLGIGLCLALITAGVLIAYHPPFYRCEGIDIKRTTEALIADTQLFESLKSEEHETFKEIKEEIDGFPKILKKSKPVNETAIEYLDIISKRLTDWDNHDFKVNFAAAEMMRLARKIERPYVYIDLLKYFLVLILVLGGVIGLFLVFRWQGEMELESRRKETAEKLEKKNGKSKSNT